MLTLLVLLLDTVSLMPLGTLIAAVLVTPGLLALATTCTIMVQVLPAAMEVTVPLSKLPAKPAAQPSAAGVPLPVADAIVMVENALGIVSAKVTVRTKAEPAALEMVRLEARWVPLWDLLFLLAYWGRP